MTEVATKKAVFKIHIRATIEDVWKEITKTGEALPFFFGSVMETPGLEIGAPIRMRTPSGKYTGVVGDVVEFDPPRRFAHTFRFTHLDDPECTVIYELEEADDGVGSMAITAPVGPTFAAAASEK